jgi:hypothetical protein
VSFTDLLLFVAVVLLAIGLTAIDFELKRIADALEKRDCPDCEGGRKLGPQPQFGGPHLPCPTCGGKERK